METALIGQTFLVDGLIYRVKSVLNFLHAKKCGPFVILGGAYAPVAPPPPAYGPVKVANVTPLFKNSSEKGILRPYKYYTMIFKSFFKP